MSENMSFLWALGRGNVEFVVNNSNQTIILEKAEIQRRDQHRIGRQVHNFFTVK